MAVTYAKEKAHHITGKSALAGAIRYALTRWNALLRYLADGRLEMSNNAAERGMRAPVLGRKNYLSAAPMPADNAPLVSYTIVETAKMCGINPQPYLTNVTRTYRGSSHPKDRRSAPLALDTIVPLRGRDGAPMPRSSADAYHSASLWVHILRGSSSGGGVTSMRKAITLLNNGRQVAITPEGPRGPNQRGEGRRPSCGGTMCTGSGRLCGRSSGASALVPT